MGLRCGGWGGAGVFRQPEGRGLASPLGNTPLFFQAEVFAILACAHDIQCHGPEKNISTVTSRFFVFEGGGENERKMCENEKSKNNFFNEESRALSFASWQNFTSIENMTFQDIKCIHGTRQLHCAHRKTL
jgi:hypothetical protein